MKSDFIYYIDFRNVFDVHGDTSSRAHAVDFIKMIEAYNEKKQKS